MTKFILMKGVKKNMVKRYKLRKEIKDFLEDSIIDLLGIIAIILIIMWLYVLNGGV